MMTDELIAPADDYLLIADEMDRWGEATIDMEGVRVTSDGDTRIVSDGDTRIVEYEETIETILLTAPASDYLLIA